MKKLAALSLLVFFSTAFFSCKKNAAQNTTTSDYYIKGKKDGVAFNFTTNAHATSLNMSGVNMFNLLAWGTGSEGFNIGINSSNGTAIGVGTYREDYAGLNYILGGVYNPNSTQYVYAAGIQQSANPMVVTITTKTTTEVTGTFSGAFYKQDVNGSFFPQFITITEGQFRLKLN